MIVSKPAENYGEEVQQHQEQEKPLWGMQEHEKDF